MVSSDGVHSGNSDVADLTTDCVIVGSGPAGGSLAAFLASNGVKGILLSRESNTAVTPRAHLTNAASMGKYPLSNSSSEQER